MRKNIIYLASALFLCLSLSQCTEKLENDVNGGKTITVSLVASNGGTKTVSSERTTGLAASWETGDKLYVVAPSGGSLGYLIATQSGTTAQFTGSISAWSGTQDLHFYYLGKGESIADGATSFSYDVSSQSGTLEYVATKQLMHASKASVAAGTTDFGSIQMTNLFSVAKFDLATNLDETATITCDLAFSTASLNLATGVLSPSVGTINLGTNIPTPSTYYMVLIPGSSFLRFSDGTAVMNMYKYIDADRFYCSSLSRAAVVVANTGDGALHGKFSVSNDKQIRFAKGNLQFRASDKTWRFANRQWHYLGSSGYTDYDGTVVPSGNLTAVANRSTQSNWIDLFGHATGDVNHATAYPWQSSNTTSNYLAINTNDGFASSSNIYDWGHNIGDGSTWYTLTNDQWVYLLNTRSASTIGSTNNSRYARVRITDEFSNAVDGICGFFIFPDVISWDTSTMGSVPTGINSTGTLNWNSTTLYTYAQYQAIESAGVVFLPANGARNILAISNTDKGYYRSSSYTNKPNYLLFRPSGVSPSGEDATISHGLGVRLVKDDRSTMGGTVQDYELNFVDEIPWD